MTFETSVDWWHVFAFNEYPELVYLHVLRVLVIHLRY